MKKGIGKLFLCLLFVPFGALAQDVTDTKASAFNFEASYIAIVR